MILGTLLTQWTIRLALACFVAYLAGSLVARGPRWPIVARWVWTVGCGLFLVHVACAFHFYHHWSHAVAWEETARQTRELIGVAFGDGIYFSYLFLVLWVSDVITLWTCPVRLPPGKDSRTTRPRPLVAAWRGVVIAFLVFIAVNGAIIFESGPTRGWGIAASIALASLALWRAYQWISTASRPNAAPIEPAIQNSGLGVQE